MTLTVTVTPPTPSTPASAPSARGDAVPFVVAVTGHRDLVAAELPLIRECVRACLQRLRSDYPGRIVSVMSALAEGADRLVAEVAIELGLPLTVVLPMPRAMYEQDFATAGSLQQFTTLCAAATDIFALPINAGQRAEDIAMQGNARSLQYAAVGVFLCAHCHVLLALWDGRDSDQLGGTAQVVRFHHDDVMPGYAPRANVSLLSLTDDESDLVYHVVCSRDRVDGAPAPGLQPAQTFWFTRDEAHPRSAEMPTRYRRVFQHAHEFSREAQLFASRIDQERTSLLRDTEVARRAPGLRDIDHVFGAADWLAVRYRKRVLLTLKAGHLCALFAAIGYLSYTDLQSTPTIIVLILALMLAAVGINVIAVRSAWHRKYLDYRTLAEGLRVQIYWAAAGVTSGNVSKFAHDNCLQMRDVELGWIRNVMRVAGTECDVAPIQTREGLAFVQQAWIGNANTGQLGYYRQRAQERARDTARTRRIGRFGIVIGLLALVALLFVGPTLPEAWRTPIVYTMGVVLLVVGVRQSYAKSTAESELIKQYEFMHRIFRNARRRIADTSNDIEQRRILKLLGDSALEEHAEWILIHRERAIDEEDGLRLG